MGQVPIGVEALRGSVTSMLVRARLKFRVAVCLQQAGNLPTEVVTKRDIFHIFHRFGRLAQISIKQAYGFVQFMNKEDCEAAMKSEQNGKIKDRNMRTYMKAPDALRSH